MKAKLFFSFFSIILNLFSPFLWIVSGDKAFAQNKRLWATYYGGEGSDGAKAIATDILGNVYLAGNTNSFFGIGSGGFQNNYQGYHDAFLAKFDGNGNRLWGTYYGGTDYMDMGNSIATDAAGNVYLAGNTQCTAGIASGGFQNTFGGGVDGFGNPNSDAFLVKFDAAGNRLWATYYGGIGWEDGLGIATDVTGNVYLAGVTSAADLPLPPPIDPGQAGPFWAGTVLNDPSIGTVTWNNINNAEGSADDNIYVITNTLTNGEISNYLVATNFGITIPAGMIVTGIQVQVEAKASIGIGVRDYRVFLVKGGVIQSGTLNKALGGINTTETLKTYGSSSDTWGLSLTQGDVEASDFGVAIAVTKALPGAGQIVSVDRINITVHYAVSWNVHQTYPAGSSDAFLVKFNGSGNRLWATYYGGMGGESNSTVATDVLGNVYLAGRTYSSSMVASGGFQNTHAGGSADAYLVKFDGDGNRIWATYYGGSGWDEAFNVTTDKNTGDVYLAGGSSSTTNIAFGGFQNAYGGGVNDAFLVKFNPSGNRIWATYYGNLDTQTEGDVAYNVTTDSQGNVYLAGDTYSAGSSSLASCGFQNTMMNIENQFLAKFDANGNRLCATYFGPSHEEEGRAAVDNFGNVYMGGWTQSSSGITFNGFQDIYGGSIGDAILVKFTSCINPTITVTSTDVNCNGQCNGIITGTTTGGNTGPYTYSWNTLPVQNTETASNLCTGTYTLTISDANGCLLQQSVMLSEPAVLSNSIMSTDVSCNGGNNGSATTISNGGTTPYNYQWSNGSIESQNSNLQEGTYTVTVTDFNGCSTTSTISIAAPPALTSSLTARDVLCNGRNDGIITASVSGGTAPYNYEWNNGSVEFQISNLLVGNYTVTITDNNGCTIVQGISINAMFAPSVTISSGVNIVMGESTVLSAAGGTFYLWAPSVGLSCTTCQSTVAKPQQTTIYCVTVSDANGCSESKCVVITVDTICGKIFIPSAFSPNGDGENDVFRIYGNCIKTIHLDIYDRWGEEVFESDNINDSWDGYYKGKLMNQEVFVYSFEGTLMNEEKIVKRGNILLIH